MRGQCTYTLGELARFCGVEVEGDPHTPIGGVGTLEGAEPGEITFLTNPLYRAYLGHTRAAAVILRKQDREATDLPCLITDNPHGCYAQVARKLFPEVRPRPGIHRTAEVHPEARVSPLASIGPQAVIEAGALIDDGVVVGAGGYVGERVHLAQDVFLYPRVTLYAGVTLGPRTLVHSGAVIGADGFGMAWQEGQWLKVPQVGSVRIGADVEIGANTTIDRGAIEDTVIEEGVKLDNLIQIAHNCRIGAHTVIAGCTGISGSSRIGARCRIGGGVGIVGHVEICDGVTVSGFSLITKSITRPGVYTSAIPSQPHRAWLHTLAHLRGLPEWAERVRRLEMAQVQHDHSIENGE